MCKINLIDYEVDEAMLGPEWSEDKYSLEDFCEILQELCEEKCLFFNIVAITDSYNGATHRFDDADYSLWSHEHLGIFPHYNYGYDKIPWETAVEKYLENWEREKLSTISNDDLTEIPEKLREAIITKRDNPTQFTKQMYQNIYHNLIRKNADKFEKLSKKYAQKSKLCRIFNQIFF
jgi:hypothetical protein